MKIQACSLFALTLAAFGCGDDAGGALPDAGASGDAGSGADAIEVDCSDSEVLPDVIDTPVEVGPGCVTLDRTRVEDGGTLTIAAGTRVLVRPGGYLRTSPFDDGGTLIAKGTEAAPIVFTSEQAAPLAGDWGCLYLGSGGDATELSQVVVEYAGGACGASGIGYETGIVVADAQRAISDVTVRHSAGHGMILLNAAAVRVFQNNRFADNVLPSLQVNQNQVVTVGPGHVFDDADDYIEIETKFSLGRSGTWTRQDVPWRIVGHMQIGSNDNTVTIEPGTEIQLDGDSLEVFMANLIAEGTAEAPIVFTSARATPAAGDWGCVYISTGVDSPRFQHVVFEYAGGGAGCTGADYPTALIVPGTATVTDNEFRDVAGYAIRTVDACPPSFCDNTFTNVAEAEELRCTVGSTPTNCP